MRFSRIVSLLRSAALSLRTPRAQAFGCGLLGGLYLLDWTHQFAAHFGTSLIVVVSSALAIAFGCELAWSRPRLEAGPHRHPAWRLATALLIPAIHTILFPVGMIGARGLAGFIPVGTMAIPIVGLLFFWCLAAVLLAFPIFWLARQPVLLSELYASPANLHGRSRADRHTLSFWGLCGTAYGLLAGVFFAAPIIGAHSTGVLAAVCGGAAGVAVLLRSRQPAHIHEEATTTVAQETVAAPVALPVAVHSDRSQGGLRGALPALRGLAIVACCGAGAALAARVSHQLMPVSGFIIYTEWAALIGGAAIGAAITRRIVRRASFDHPHNFDSSAAVICLLVAACGTLSLGLFGKLIDLSLGTTSSISFVPLLMLLRGAIAALFVLPYGLASGGIAALWKPNSLNTSAKGDSHETGSAGPLFGLPWQFVAWGAGLVGVRWALASGALAGDLVLLFTLLLFLLCGACLWSARSFPRGWLARGLAAGAFCVIIASGWLRTNYDPARSARILFSSNVFAAHRSGIDRRSLTALDDGRNVALREGERGTYTAWRYRGAQIHIRENGIPRGSISTAPVLCPQYSAEVLPTVLALTLHDDPRHVLLLGLGSGTPLSTCLAFPIIDVTCVEGDAALLDLAERFVWSKAENDPRDDRRVRLLPVDPALAAVCREDRYDVILSSAEPLALWQAEPHYTREFYRSAARRLATDGLFVQRFQHFDYGPQPMQTVVKTLRQAFSDVMAFQAAPGELIFVASNSARGIVRDGLLTRFQAEQVRSTLAQVGWDWTVPLNLAAWQNTALDEIARAARTNTATNGRFAFTIPQEVMRWGPKGQELAEAFGPQVSRLLECDNMPQDDPEVLRRLSEVVAQHKLMTDYPDQWWVYRKTIRDEITDRPRSLIQQVSQQVGANNIHPDDKRRLQYFTALGEASRKKDPSPAEILRIAEFESPYDPFVSYFLHQEVAALYARSSQSFKGAELAHRLHAIHYGDPRDRSVRDIVEAMSLLMEHPEACSDPAERWDHLNSLLQVMKTRWETRGAVEPKASRIVLNDLEKSISMIETTFETMNDLCADAEVDQADWRARRAYLDRALVRPLRTYRSNLLPYHLQKERRTRATAALPKKPSEVTPADFNVPGL